MIINQPQIYLYKMAATFARVHVLYLHTSVTVNIELSRTTVLNLPIWVPVREGPKLQYGRDANETFSFETETRPRRSFLASRRDQDRDLPFRDRDVFRDVTNGTLC